MTRRISDVKTATDRTRLVKALDLAVSGDGLALSKPSGLFGFSAIIETDKIKLDNEQFDFEFDVPFDDDTIPNESEIKIYNLSNATASNFKKDNLLTITAGYGTDTGIILKGKISKVITKHDGVDKTTTVYVLDNANYEDTDIVEQTFAEGISASYILQALLTMLNLPIAVFEVQRDHRYTKEESVKGSLTEAIKKYADVCGVSVYIQKQQVYCRPIWQGDNIHFTVCSQTGMIDAPEPFEEENTSEEYKDNVTGYNIKMLFQHRMCTAAITEVESLDYAGSFRVCSGTHSFDGLSATTEIKCIENITTEIVEIETYDDDDDYDYSDYNDGDYLTESDVVWTEKEVPLGTKNYPKSYMSYRLYTDKTGSGYEYLWGSECSTSAGGLRMYKDCYCCAFGSYYGADGTFVKVEWTNPSDGSKKTIICVKGDEKKDSETDSKNQYHPYEGGTGSVCEFIVDGNVITSSDDMYAVAKSELGLELSAYITGIWTTTTYPYTTTSADYGDGSTANSVINVAESQIGTEETGSNGNPYGAEIGDNYVPWCGYFVAWCLKHGGFGLPDFNYASAAAFAYAAQYQGWGVYHAQGSGYEPKRGDIFVRNYRGNEFESSGHVGFVRYNYDSSDGACFISVEGNTSSPSGGGEGVWSKSDRVVTDYTFVTPPYSSS